MSKQDKKTLVPALRFPEFRDKGEWDERPLGKEATIVMGASPKSEFYNEGGNGLPLLQGNADIKNKVSAPRIFTSQITKECQKGDILMSVRAPVGTVAKSIHHACIGRGMAAIRAKKDNSQEFLYQWLLSFEPKWQNISQGGTFDAVNSDEIRQLITSFPSSNEQQKIADCLTSIDELITAQTQKLEALKAHKKGLMQRLFPAKGETLPKLRFPEFQDKGEWELKELCDCLDYLQPTKYLVSSTVYDDKHKTPVLTAGKTFVLGYTNETEGVFNEKLPVIIFDDFTTASKYVDFSFKAKSSAMKILLAKGDASIKFCYESMQMIKYEVGVHERHWISIFSKLSIPTPGPKEQQKIADCLTSVDELITAQTQKLEALKAHKKGLMQRLFPVMNEVGE
ncbi:restriction endonuclease subunit S [Chloroflexota bacterium]